MSSSSIFLPVEHCPFLLLTVLTIYTTSNKHTHTSNSSAQSLKAWCELLSTAAIPTPLLEGVSMPFSSLAFTWSTLASSSSQNLLSNWPLLRSTRCHRSPLSSFSRLRWLLITSKPPSSSSTFTSATRHCSFTRACRHRCHLTLYTMLTGWKALESHFLYCIHTYIYKGMGWAINTHSPT
jgi:hypothetical protein